MRTVGRIVAFLAAFVLVVLGALFMFLYLTESGMISVERRNAAPWPTFPPRPTYTPFPTCESPAPSPTPNPDLESCNPSEVASWLNDVRAVMYDHAIDENIASLLVGEGMTLVPQVYLTEMDTFDAAVRMTLSRAERLEAPPCLAEANDALIDALEAHILARFDAPSESEAAGSYLVYQERLNALDRLINDAIIGLQFMYPRQ